MCGSHLVLLRLPFIVSVLLCFVVLWFRLIVLCLVCVLFVWFSRLFGLPGCGLLYLVWFCCWLCVCLVVFGFGWLCSVSCVRLVGGVGMCSVLCCLVSLWFVQLGCVLSGLCCSVCPIVSAHPVWLCLLWLVLCGLVLCFVWLCLELWVGGFCFVWWCCVWVGFV